MIAEKKKVVHLNLQDESFNDLLKTRSADQLNDSRIIINMGPQHPSTHGVLRLIVELEGEIVQSVVLGLGYLHTGIEKNIEYRMWHQGVTFITRMDYLQPFFNEGVYVSAVERLLDIEDKIPRRATLIRLLCLELNRISSHAMAAGSFGHEMGVSTLMTNCLEDREGVLAIFEDITGLRMNHAYFRIGGVARDIESSTIEKIEKLVEKLPKRVDEYIDLLYKNPIFKSRSYGVAYLPQEELFSLGVTGPILRAAGVKEDLRKKMPYWGYEEFDFSVPVETAGDACSRYMVRLQEVLESGKIIRQIIKKLKNEINDGTMVDDPKIAWPSKLEYGKDGLGNSNQYLKKIMNSSMEALIYHFKMTTEGFKVPSGYTTSLFESPRGVLGCTVVSDGTTRPYRVHMSDPSFTNLQSLNSMAVGGSISDLIVALGSIDPVMGGVDR